MKILFLDVDGVLNMHNSGGMYALNRKRLQLLEKIITDTGAEIVLSSSWRKDANAFKRLCRVLGYRGLKIRDKTPEFWRDEEGKRLVRGHEIKDWLNRHPEVTEYVIVDDDSDMLDSQLRHFVQTEPNTGLTDILAYRIIYKLNNGVEHIE